MVIDMCNNISTWIKENDWLVDAIGILFQICITLIKIAFTPLKLIVELLAEKFKFLKTCA